MYHENTTLHIALMSGTVIEAGKRAKLEAILGSGFIPERLVVTNETANNFVLRRVIFGFQVAQIGRFWLDGEKTFPLRDFVIDLVSFTPQLRFTPVRVPKNSLLSFEVECLVTSKFFGQVIGSEFK